MIAGLIEAHIGASQYSVRISYDVTKANILIAWHNATIAERTAQKEQAIIDLNNAIANKVENLPRVRYSLEVLINLLSAEILQLTKSNEFIERNKGGEKVITAYSNIYDESLSGIVAVELIAGSIENPVIIANQSIEKRVTTAINMAKEHCFSNFALMTGWLKWAQKYSFARIDIADVTATGTMATLNNKLSLIGGVVPFDKESISANNSYNYQVDDLALVEFDQNGNQAFKGWYKEPRLQSATLLVFRKTSYGYYTYEVYNGNTGQLVLEASHLDTDPMPAALAAIYAKPDATLNFSTVETADGTRVQIGDKVITEVLQDHWNHNIVWDYTVDSVAYQTTAPRPHTVPAYADSRDPTIPCYMYVGYRDPSTVADKYYIYTNWGVDNGVYTVEWAQTQISISAPYYRSIPGSNKHLLKINESTGVDTYYQADDRLSVSGSGTVSHFLLIDSDFNVIANPLFGVECGFISVSLDAIKEQ